MKVVSEIDGLRNPLESHTFRRLLRKVEMVAEMGLNIVKMQRFEFMRWNYKTWEEEEAGWNLYTLVYKTIELDEKGRELGLLEVDGRYLCVSCCTSEFVRLVDGCPVCQRCGTHYKGWK